MAIVPILYSVLGTEALAADFYTHRAFDSTDKRTSNNHIEGDLSKIKGAFVTSQTNEIVYYSSGTAKYDLSSASDYNSINFASGHWVVSGGYDGSIRVTGGTFEILNVEKVEIDGAFTLLKDSEVLFNFGNSSSGTLVADEVVLESGSTIQINIYDIIRADAGSTAEFTILKAKSCSSSTCISDASTLSYSSNIFKLNKKIDGDSLIISRSLKNNALVKVESSDDRQTKTAMKIRAEDFNDLRDLSGDRSVDAANAQSVYEGFQSLADDAKSKTSDVNTLFEEFEKLNSEKDILESLVSLQPEKQKSANAVMELVAGSVANLNQGDFGKRSSGGTVSQANAKSGISNIRSDLVTHYASSQNQSAELNASNALTALAETRQADEDFTRPSGYTVWARGNFSYFSNVNSSNNDPDSHSLVAALGLETQAVGNGYVLGISGFGQQSQWDQSNGNRSNGDVWGAGLSVFGGKLLPHGYVFSNITYSYSKVTQTRKIDFLNESAKAEYDSHSYSAQLASGIDLVAISPDITLRTVLRFSRIEKSAYTETGSIAALTVKESSFNQWVGGLGITYAFPLVEIANNYIVPSIHYDFELDFDADRSERSQVTSRFNAGGKDFVTQSSPINPYRHSIAFDATGSILDGKGFFEAGVSASTNGDFEGVNYNATLKLGFNF